MSYELNTLIWITFTFHYNLCLEGQLKNDRVSSRNMHFYAKQTEWKKQLALL